MARTLINGAEQIQAASIPWSAMVAGAIVPTTSLVDGTKFIKNDGTQSTMAAALNMGSNLINGVSTPVSATDAANKAYVDQKTGGIGGIHTVRILAAANQVVATGGLTAIDGVTPVAGDIILCTGQTTTSQNGPWTAAAGAWTRPAWWAGASLVNEGQYFMIAEGTTYKDTKFWCTTIAPITVDTTAVAFSQDLNAIAYTNGTGLTLTGNVFSVNYGATSVTAAAGNDTRIANAVQTTGLGTNVLTALGVAVGTAGSFVVNGGALGTPASGVLTNATGLPIAGITGLGTGVGAALAVASGAANGLPVLAAGGVLAAAQHPALSGDVTCTAGSLATTVNNTAGTGFVKYTNFVGNETVTGTINGANTTFTLANTPANISGGVSSLMLFYAGTLLKPGAGNDYTLSGSTITMLWAPTNSANGNFTADYLK